MQARTYNQVGTETPARTNGTPVELGSTMSSNTILGRCFYGSIIFKGGGALATEPSSERTSNGGRYFYSVLLKPLRYIYAHAESYY